MSGPFWQHLLWTAALKRPRDKAVPWPDSLGGLGLTVSWVPLLQDLSEPRTAPQAGHASYSLDLGPSPRMPSGSWVPENFGKC